MTTFLIAFMSVAFGVREPVDYRRSHEMQAAEKVAFIASNGNLEKALKYGEKALRQHPNSALIRYEMGLACNQANRIKEALSRYSDALKYDSELIAARYDRAELRLLNNDVEGAKSDLNAIAGQESTHWGVNLRLAQIAGTEGRDEDFSEHLMVAVENGFQLSSLADLGSPWREWIHHPQKSRRIRRIVLLYANGSLWDQLQR